MSSSLLLLPFCQWHRLPTMQTCRKTYCQHFPFRILRHFCLHPIPFCKHSSRLYALPYPVAIPRIYTNPFCCLIFFICTLNFGFGCANNNTSVLPKLNLSPYLLDVLFYSFNISCGSYLFSVIMDVWSGLIVFLRTFFVHIFIPSFTPELNNN